jgi:Variant SH3 domain
MKTLVVTTPHRSEYPRPISFEAGAVLTVGERSEGSQGWVDWYLCSLPGQADGWVPLQILRFVNATTAIAQEAYTARELDVDVGDRLEASRTLNGWAWCLRLRDGASGWVPLNNVEALEDSVNGGGPGADA